jgi:hypothetical protein
MGREMNVVLASSVIPSEFNTPCDAVAMLRCPKLNLETPVGSPCGVCAPWSRDEATEKPSQRAGSHTLIRRRPVYRFFQSRGEYSKLSLSDEERYPVAFVKPHAIQATPYLNSTPHTPALVVPSESSACVSERVQ